MNLIPAVLVLLLVCVLIAPFFMLALHLVCKVGISFGEAFRRTLLVASMILLALVALGMGINQLAPFLMIRRVLIPIVYVLVPILVGTLCFEPMRMPPDSERLGWIRALKVAGLLYLLVVVFLVVPLYCLRFLTE